MWNRGAYLGILLVIAGFVVSSTASGEQNPINTNHLEKLYWIDNQGTAWWENLIKLAVYDPSAEGWCGHYAAGPTKYRHGHLLTSFDGDDYICRFGYKVTKDMVDRYWDAQFGAGYVQVGEVDQTYNCHGYSTGYSSSWIFSQGMQDILQVEYEDSYSLDVVLQYTQYSENIDHSKKILEVYDAGGWNLRVRKVREKSRDSGIYERGNMNRSLVNGYKKKP